MEKCNSTRLLMAEYESLKPENRQKFLELVTKKNFRKLTEEQFWGNFQIICEYLELIGSSEDIPVEAVRAGFYIYEYLSKRLGKLAKDHHMTQKCDSFYQKVRESFPEDYFQCFANDKQENLSDSEINRVMEAYVKNMFLLIANKNRSFSEIKIDVIDYTWQTFGDDIRRGPTTSNGKPKIKKGYLTHHNRLLLIKMEKEKLDFPCARDTYIYCAIAMYYMKNQQERWKDNG